MGSPALLKATEEALLREGLSVQSAGNGIDAVLMALKSRPGCVLCGQVLAGMDGMKVCRLLNSLFPVGQIPVIVSIPDSKPEMRNRALSAGAAAVVDYSTPFQETADLIKELTADRISTAQSGDLTISRDRVLPMAADCLEDSLELLETVVRLAGELRSVTSISEACRKVSASILRGLGFQRVWIGLVNRSRTGIDAVSYKGRGITGDSIKLSPAGSKLPADIAVSTGEQIPAWESEFSGASFDWVGSNSFVDTPIKFDGTVKGIIRCDNGISRRRPSKESLKSLRMLSDLLSSFLRYLDAQNHLDDQLTYLDVILDRLRTAVFIMDSLGVIREFSGDSSLIPGTADTVRGAFIGDLLPKLSPKAVEQIVQAVKSRNDFSLESVEIAGENRFISVSSQVVNTHEIMLMLSERTDNEKLSRRISMLEFETDAMASLAADLTSEGDVREICRTIVRTVENFYPEESIAILAPESSLSAFSPDSLFVYAVSGSKHRQGALLPGATILLGKEGETGIVGEAVRTRRVTNIPDVFHCDYYITGLLSTRSELAIPMLCRGRLVGLIDIQSPVVNRFKADDIRRLNNITGFAAGVLESALQQTELINMARRDRLTGLHNMTFFEERYPEEFDRALRYEYSFSLIMMDIDDFKNYNDTHGHPMGNVLLQKVTTAIGTALRDVDILVRYGGEEFICVLPLTDKQVAVEIAERIKTRVLEANSDIPHSESQPRGCVSLSLGVATFPEDSRERDELIEVADQRMYRAKRAGKNSVCHS